jgi:type IV secretion system protein VirB9
MKAASCTIAVLLVAASILHAEALPTPGSTDARIQTATYRDDEVYALTGTVGYQIDLVFDHDEHFVGLAAGDMGGLSFESQANHLFLKPKAAPVATNLTILTDRRQYIVAYAVNPPLTGRSVTGSASPVSPTLYALRFQYPTERTASAARAAAAQVQADTVTRALSTPRPAVNTDYAFCGARAIRPTRVTDDGVHTHFTFAPRAEVPAIFIRRCHRRASNCPPIHPAARQARGLCGQSSL